MQAHSWYHACMATQLTIRGVPPEVRKQLDALSRARGTSLNATVVDILRKAVDAEARRERIRTRYGGWTKQDLQEFEALVKEQRQIDESLWRD